MARRNFESRSATDGGFGGGQRPRPPQAAANSPPPRKPGLTAIFNRAAKREAKVVPVSRMRAEELKKKLSRPSLTLTMSITGTVEGSYAPNRDRKIRHEIKAIEKRLSEKQDAARKAFQKAKLKQTATHAFNRTVRRRM